MLPWVLAVLAILVTLGLLLREHLVATLGQVVLCPLEETGRVPKSHLDQ